MVPHWAVPSLHCHDSCKVFILVSCDIFSCPVELEGICHSSLITTELWQVDIYIGYVKHRHAYNYVHMYVFNYIILLSKCLLNKYIIQYINQPVLMIVPSLKLTVSQTNLWRRWWLRYKLVKCCFAEWYSNYQRAINIVE